MFGHNDTSTPNPFACNPPIELRASVIHAGADTQMTRSMSQTDHTVMTIKERVAYSAVNGADYLVKNVIVKDMVFF